MNNVTFTAFLVMQDVMRKIIINFDYYNESISTEIEDRTVNKNTGVFDFNEKVAQRIVIPEKLQNALVIGISEEGSTRSATRLAWSKLLNVKRACSSGEPFSSMDLTDVDYIIISGGYDNSVNNRLNAMIGALGKNPQLAEFKPNIIFAGSRLSAEVAKKELALPGIQFRVLKNILENETTDESGQALQTLPVASAAAQNITEGRVKITDFSYTEALRKISEVFCVKRGEKVLSALFTGNYSLLSQAERGARTTSFKNYAVPQNAETLNAGVFKSVFNDLFVESRTVFDENFLLKDVLPIDSDKESVIFEPDRIVAVSLTEKIEFENFVDLVCVPGMTHGTFYFLFDNAGIVLAAMTVFLSQNKDSNSFLRGFFNTKDVKSGWIFIPYGKFKKGVPAIFIEKLENDRKVDLVLKWGERKVVEVNSNSVVEIHAAKGVYLSDSSESTRKTIGTKESCRTLIFDLREEMHR